MARAVLLFRLIVRPMLRDRARALLTVSAVALGVAVIVAVDLAGDASMGSFRSSLESLQGRASYEITQVGGIPDTVYGRLARLEEPLAFSPRIEGFALLPGTGEEVPIFGVDLVGDTTLGETGSRPRGNVSELLDVPSVWVTAALGVSPGGTLPVVAGDRRMDLVVQGVIEPSGVRAGSFLLVDIALAERLLARAGRLDRIYVHTPPGDGRDWTARLAAVLPPAASVLPAGTRTDDNRSWWGPSSSTTRSPPTSCAGASRSGSCARSALRGRWCGPRSSSREPCSGPSGRWPGSYSAGCSRSARWRRSGGRSARST